jgi:hypothetical protein
LLDNKLIPGEYPHWLSDGGGVVGVHLSHIKQAKKKNKKKNKK